MGLIMPTGESFVIAARLSGPAKTAFTAGPPAAMTMAGQPPPAPLPPQIKQSRGRSMSSSWPTPTSSTTASGCVSRTLYGKRVATPFADNGAFVLNAVENLMGSGDLISLRTRATNDRPFTVVQADSGRGAGAVPAGSRSAAGAPDRSAAAAARTRARRQRQRQAEHGAGTHRRAAGRNRPLQARTGRDAHVTARRAAQSAQGHRCAGRLPRLREHRRSCRSWWRALRFFSPGSRRRRRARALAQ